MRKAVAVVAAVMVLGLLGVTVVGLLFRQRAWRTFEISGVVLRDDSDPRNQASLAEADVVVTDGTVSAETKSDSAGFFRLTLHPRWERERDIRLTFRRAGYEPLTLRAPATQDICVARMKPLVRVVGAKLRPTNQVSGLRVRYSMKSTNTTNVGSEAKPFEAVNTGGVSCGATPPCSPDGKWRATLNTQVFDAGVGHEYRNVRLSCTAGPCPFTRVEGSDLQDEGRIAKISVLNWSDTATFLFEADVMHSMLSDVVRQAYPTIFGPALTFTLPRGAEGPSIEADLNGLYVIFPLGPELHLSWAECSAVKNEDQSMQIRCALKPGYEFR